MDDQRTLILSVSVFVRVTWLFVQQGLHKLLLIQLQNCCQFHFQDAFFFRTRDYDKELIFTEPLVSEIQLTIDQVLMNIFNVFIYK